MNFDERQINKLLFVTQGAGAIFVSIFLIAYLSGLPTTAVLHSDPIVRTSLTGVGIVFLLLIFSFIIVAAASEKTKTI